MSVPVPPTATIPGRGEDGEPVSTALARRRPALRHHPSTCSRTRRCAVERGVTSEQAINAAYARESKHGRDLVVREALARSQCAHPARLWQPPLRAGQPAGTLRPARCGPPGNSSHHLVSGSSGTLAQIGRRRPRLRKAQASSACPTGPARGVGRTVDDARPTLWPRSTPRRQVGPNVLPSKGNDLVGAQPREALQGEERDPRTAELAGVAGGSRIDDPPQVCRVERRSTPPASTALPGDQRARRVPRGRRACRQQCVQGQVGRRVVAEHRTHVRRTAGRRGGASVPSHGRSVRWVHGSQATMTPTSAKTSRRGVRSTERAGLATMERSWDTSFARTLELAPSPNRRSANAQERLRRGSRPRRSASSRRSKNANCRIGRARLSHGFGESSSAPCQLLPDGRPARPDVVVVEPLEPPSTPRPGPRHAVAAGLPRPRRTSAAGRGESRGDPGRGTRPAASPQRRRSPSGGRPRSARQPRLAHRTRTRKRRAAALEIERVCVRLGPRRLGAGSTRAASALPFSCRNRAESSPGRAMQSAPSRRSSALTRERSTRMRRKVAGEAGNAADRLEDRGDFLPVGADRPWRRAPPGIIPAAPRSAAPRDPGP